MIDFKICFDSEKNSEIIGRMFIAHCPKINEILGFIAVKNIIWIDRNTKLVYKMQSFLSTTCLYYKKIFVIIPRLQKQTP